MNSLHPVALKRKKRLLLMLPLLVVPFVTFAFWMLQTYGFRKDRTVITGGLNAHLPDAQLKEEPANKLAFYELVKSDSIKLNEKIKHDPFRDKDSIDVEQRAYRQLDELDRMMSREPPQLKPRRKPLSKNTSPRSPEMERLEQMVRTVKEKPERDPEISQLDSLLDKIIDIQHPQRLVANEPAVNQSKKFVVSVAAQDEISFASISDDSFAHPAFYTLQDTTSPVANSVATRAVIEARHTITDGAVVVLRALERLKVGDMTLMRGHLLSGICSLQGERLIIRINSIMSGSVVLPVALTVLDLDGVEGIYVPDASTQQRLKETGMRSLSSAGIRNLGEHAAAQLATAGIEGVKSMIMKRSRQTKILLPAGYQVLLINQPKP